MDSQQLRLISLFFSIYTEVCFTSSAAKIFSRTHEVQFTVLTVKGTLIKKISRTPLALFTVLTRYTAKIFYFLGHAIIGSVHCSYKVHC